MLKAHEDWSSLHPLEIAQDRTTHMVVCHLDRKVYSQATYVVKYYVSHQQCSEHSQSLYSMLDGAYPQRGRLVVMTAQGYNRICTVVVYILQTITRHIVEWVCHTVLVADPCVTYAQRLTVDDSCIKLTHVLRCTALVVDKDRPSTVVLVSQ